MVLLHLCVLACALPLSPTVHDTTDCAIEFASPNAQAPATRELWRAVLASPGGELPFGLLLTPGSDRQPAQAVIANGEERITIPTVEYDGRRLRLHFDHYASEILATLNDRGELAGEWRKRSGPDKEAVLPFHANRILNFQRKRKREAEWSHEYRFLQAATKTEVDRPAIPVHGEWKVNFHGESGEEQQPAVARFEQSGTRVLGTFLTPVGDYRYLEGSFVGNRLRLSCFDGAHAFLFHAELDQAGRLHGEFWSRDSWHERWSGQRPAIGEDPVASLPNPLDFTRMQAGKEQLDFRFPDLDGKPVSLSDERFRNKVVLVEIFGSWCPNCHDAAPVLADFRRKYGAQGLEILGLAYELTGDAARDAEQVRAYAKRHACDWPILLAGTAPKAGASKTLPSLSGIKSYPTTLFVGRDGKVREIYTGFSGPATGADHQALLDFWHTTVRKLLAEDAP